MKFKDDLSTDVYALLYDKPALRDEVEDVVFIIWMNKLVSSGEFEVQDRDTLRKLSNLIKAGRLPGYGTIDRRRRLLQEKFPEIAGSPKISEQDFVKEKINSEDAQISFFGK